MLSIKPKPKSPETIEKIRKWHTGYKYSDEARMNMSMAQKGHPSPKKGKTNVEMYGETRALEINEKNRLAHKGKPISEERKRVLRECNIGRHNSDESKRKMSDAAKGRIINDETRKKISESVKAYYLNKRKDKK